MNLSYEPVSSAARAARASRALSCAASYVPLEYREACHSSPSEEESSGQAAESAGAPAPFAETAEAQPDSDQLLAEEIERQRRAITLEVQQEAEREIQRARAAVGCSIEQFGQQREEYFRQAEVEIVSLALAIAQRILHRESQIDPRLLAGLVRHELEQMESATRVRLLVSADTLSYWNEALRDIARPVELVADAALAPGDARIETALGSTTVSLEGELKEIERGFFDLLSRRPGAAAGKAARVQ